MGFLSVPNTGNTCSASGPCGFLCSESLPTDVHTAGPFLSRRSLGWSHKTPDRPFLTALPNAVLTAPLTVTVADFLCVIYHCLEVSCLYLCLLFFCLLFLEGRHSENRSSGWFIHCCVYSNYSGAHHVVDTQNLNVWYYWRNEPLEHETVFKAKSWTYQNYSRLSGRDFRAKEDPRPSSPTTKGHEQTPAKTSPAVPGEGRGHPLRT